MESRARWIGKHAQRIVFGLSRMEFRLIALILVPTGLPLLIDFLMGITHVRGIVEGVFVVKRGFEVSSFAALFLALLFSSCPLEAKPTNRGEKKMVKPPIAKKVKHILEQHSDKRNDEYFWMNKRDSKEVLEYLRDENAYAEQVLKPTESLQNKLFEEMKSRIVEDESSAPVRFGDFYYYRRYNPGQEYPIAARKRGSLSAKEEILIDGNEWAKGHTYFQMSGTQVTFDHKLVAVAMDTTGRRFYDIKIKDLENNKLLPVEFKNTTGNFTWIKDNKTLYFTKQDPETLRAYQVYRFTLGVDKDPVLVFEEKDITYRVGVGSSKSGDKIFIGSSKRDSSEIRWASGEKPTSDFKIFYPRQENWEYDLNDGGDRFYILTNYNAENYQVMEAPLNAQSPADWKVVLPHSIDTLRQDLEVYRDFLVVEERSKGLTQLRVVPRGLKGKERVLDFKDPVFVVGLMGLPEYNSQEFRFSYESMNQPEVIFDEHYVSQKREVKKEKKVPGFNPSLYESRRLWAKAKDGREIPLSVLLKKGTKLSKNTPVLMDAYGSYGMSMEPWFRSSMISLVDRGFIFVVPHIRGGSEMGRYWYEEGRLANKMNTFTDFIAAAEHLIDEGYTSSKHLHISGGSAGGLLMGAVLNLRPELFLVAHAAVPFVDVLTTMLDESIPLTTFEYKEWGDPRIKADYLVMKSYSPYDNVKAQSYPHIFVTTGYHDSQVQYWEPAKWVAKLRDMKTDKNELIFLTEMSAGHSGASGRYESLKIIAKGFAFDLMLEGIDK